MLNTCISSVDETVDLSPVTGQVCCLYQILLLLPPVPSCDVEVLHSPQAQGHQPAGCFYDVHMFWKASQMLNLKFNWHVLGDSTQHADINTIFMPPAWKVCWGHLVIGPSICPFVCLSIIPSLLQTKCNF